MNSEIEAINFIPTSKDFLRLVDADKNDPLRLFQRELAGHEFLFRNGIITEREYHRFLSAASSRCHGTTALYLAKRKQQS